MLPSLQERLIVARRVLERGDAVPSELVSEPIRASWERCLAAGLDPSRPPPIEMVTDATLNEARQRRDLLRRLALGEMANLYQQIAGTNFMIAFAAADGLLLDTIADPSFGDAAHAASIRPGTIWRETRCGTNALGSVAATGRAIAVHGSEHFFSRYGAITCTAAPVFAPDGALAGVLDASSDARSRQEHTRVLVAMAATQIENGMFREHHRTDVIIAFHNRREYLNTLSAGLLAVDPGGTILAANGRARFMLQGLAIRRGRNMTDLFDTAFDDLLQACRHDTPPQLMDKVGSLFAARVDNVRHARPVQAVSLPVLGRAVVARPVIARPEVAVSAKLVLDDKTLAATLAGLEVAAARKLPILIRGETGTGKEQAARHLHRASGRSGAFVAINCAALPDSLVEAELFGHADGAFTGARRGGAAGLVREADGGTLFLDEIGDMRLPLQSVLLRLLDDWTVRPVGGGRSRTVDVLLVSATNVDLSEAIAAGRFRADLYYRLATVDAVLPPLRERIDFAALAQAALASVAPGWRISPDAVAELARRAWPGNIRELRAVLARLTLQGAFGVIERCMVDRPAIDKPGHATVEPLYAAATLRDSVQEQIRRTLVETDGNVSETARRLGVSRNTVYRALPVRSGTNGTA